ncbi:MAG: type VI secretion system-associated FHA domain protein TagH [Thalassobaculaceae bacterium]
MRLVLEVTSFQRSLMGSESRHVFDGTGGVIGRGRRCDWRLPDPDRFVSTTHADIAFDGSRFHVTDLSTNGLFVNGSATPLGRGVRRPLQDGDRLTLGDFELVAHLREADLVRPDDREPAIPDPDDQFTDDQEADHQEPAPDPDDEDTEPDRIPPFPDPDVLNPPPRRPANPTAIAPDRDPLPPTVPPPPPRWGGRERPAPPAFDRPHRPVSTDRRPDTPAPAQGFETPTLEAEYNAAIADLDLKKLIGDTPADPETEPAPSSRVPLPPPPPALGRRQPSADRQDPPVGRPRAESGLGSRPEARPEPTPPRADMPADLPARGIADLIGAGSAGDVPLSPDAVEAGLRLPSHLLEIERKARLWDEFVRLYRARSDRPRGRS